MIYNLLILLFTTNAFGMGLLQPKPEISKKHCTTFLDNGASWTTHNYFSDNQSAEQKKEIVNRVKSRGYTRIYLMATNQGDYGGGNPIEYNHAKKDSWLKALKSMREKGLGTVMWVRTDDSPKYDKWTDNQWKSYMDTLVKDLDSQIDEYVMCLECNEYWSQSRTIGLTNYLRGLTKKDVGVHTTGVSAIGYASSADKYYLQTGFNKPESEIIKLVKQAVAQFGGRPVILAEYSKTDDAKAHKLCAAGMANGADGCGNGCD